MEVDYVAHFHDMKKKSKKETLDDDVVFHCLFSFSLYLVDE